MVAAVKKQIDVTRLMADLTAAKVELLSAQCAADRIHLQYILRRTSLSWRAPDAESTDRLGRRSVSFLFPDRGPDQKEDASARNE